MFAATARFAVLWCVIARDPQDPRRLLVVPADLCPRAGRADVKIDAEAPCGALTLRCRYGVWLDRRDFAAVRRAGWLDGKDLERARRRRRELESARRVAGEVSEEEGAED